MTDLERIAYEGWLELLREMQGAGKEIAEKYRVEAGRLAKIAAALAQRRLQGYIDDAEFRFAVDDLKRATRSMTAEMALDVFGARRRAVDVAVSVLVRLLTEAAAAV